MYVVDLYTLTIRPIARGVEELSLSFVDKMPWKQDIIRCLDSQWHELVKRQEAAVAADDEILAANLGDEIEQHNLCLAIIKADAIDNYKATEYLAPRPIDVAKVQIGTIIWSVDEVWQ